MYFKDDVVDINYESDDIKKKKRKKKNKFKWEFNELIPFFIFGAIFLLAIIILIISSIGKKNYFITLSGKEEITLYKGDKYNEEGYTGSDNKGHDLTSQVVVNDNVDYNTIGTYKIVYTLKTVVVERTINIIARPIGATYIHLLGDTNMYININQEYVEPGYEVIDSVDGKTLKDKVTVTNNIDNTKDGIYKVIYSVTNSSGITTSMVRTVIVMDSEISLTLANSNYTNGNVDINVYVNDLYFNYLILPNGNKIDKNLYTYTVSENGTYKFTTYNNKGGSKEKSITVNNINRTNPTGSCSGYYTDTSSHVKVNAKDDVGIQKYVIDGVTYTTSEINIDKKITKANVVIYDKAGNSSSISCNLENKVPTTSSSTGPTGTCSGYYKNGYSFITIDAKDETGIKKYVIDNKSYNTNQITIKKVFKTVDVTIYNNAGKHTKISCKLENKDSTPTGSCSGYYKNGKSYVTIKASDDSGIAKYVINGNSYTKNNITLDKEYKKVNVKIYNNNGKTTDISCSLENKNVSYKKEFKKYTYVANKGSFTYWLGIPDNASDGMPLVIFLHGDHEASKPNLVRKLKQVTYMRGYKGSTPFIYIAPVANEMGWKGATSLAAIKGLIDKIVDDYQIDTDRIYIMGFSSGAIMTWRMVNKYPEYFAAAVPMSCCANHCDAKNFTHTKIRAISGSSGNDESSYNSCMNRFVKAINEAGGSASKETYWGHTHGSVSGAIKYDDLFKWMLKQKKK